MTTRIGKIARLPAAIRHELNSRLHNGIIGRDILPWVNALPETQHILAEQFAAKPISQGNLSEWRKGGFQDWLREEERRIRLHQLSAQFRNADPEESQRRLEAHLQERVALELAEELERLATIKDSAQRWKRLQHISRELCRVQKMHLRGREVSLFQAKAAQPRRSRREEALRSGTGVPPVSFKHPNFNLNCEGETPRHAARNSTIQPANPSQKSNPFKPHSPQIQSSATHSD